MEVWRDVPGWPYRASSLGRVIGPRGRVLRSRPGSTGYLGFTACRAGERRETTIHRFVCLAFHGEPPLGMQCDHINGNQLDNRAENLRWVSPAVNYARRKSPRGELSPLSKLTAEDVAWIRSAPAHVTSADIARALHVSDQTVLLVRKGVTWREPLPVSFDNGGTSLTIRRK